MKAKIWIPAAAAVLLVGVGVFSLTRGKSERLVEVPVKVEHFQAKIAESGTVQPEHRISITAPIAGRIDQLLTDEGQSVKRGQIIAWMSSTDRAALMDSAAAQGDQAIAEMMDVYKPTPIITPSSGVIINNNMVVGQTVALGAVLFDLSDRLIVIADVDETDLGKIHMGEESTIKVDSFPDLIVKGKISRIAHQSQVKNSINVYPVWVDMGEAPKQFRAGLTASVYFVQEDMPHALTLPAWVAEGRENYVMNFQVKTADKPETRAVHLGTSNGDSVLVLDGLKEGDVVLVKSQKVLSDATSTNPFGISKPKSGGKR